METGDYLRRRPVTRRIGPNTLDVNIQITSHGKSGRTKVMLTKKIVTIIGENSLTDERSRVFPLRHIARVTRKTISV